MTPELKLRVPHIKQTQESSCGAAALSMIYSHLGIDDQTEEAIWERLKKPRPNVPGENFMGTKDMAVDGQRFGLSYFYAQASMTSDEAALQPIIQFLSLSIPVVVCQRISSSDALGHFRVVTGIDRDTIFINDPLNDKPSHISKAEFMSLWREASNGEVIGGEFFGIFKRDQVTKEAKFTVLNFWSSVNSFSITDLELI